MRYVMTVYPPAVSSHASYGSPVEASRTELEVGNSHSALKLPCGAFSKTADSIGVCNSLQLEMDYLDLADPVGILANFW